MEKRLLKYRQMDNKSEGNNVDDQPNIPKDESSIYGNGNIDPCQPASSPRSEERDVNQKREDYLSWSDYFMAVAFLSAMRSKDPSSQVSQLIYKQTSCTDF